MKIKQLKLAAALTTAFIAGPVLADVTTNKDAEPDNWNRSIKLQPLNAKQDGNVAKFSKNDQLRCWQNGDLIVLENDWKPVDSNKGKLLTSGSRKLHTFDYGETFCIYLGG